MNIFNFIKSNISIVDGISSYTTLKKIGGYFKGHCPFHGEKTASFTVSPHKNIFYCFGCHAGGDIITFIAKIENCTPIQAAKALADRYQLDISAFNQLTTEPTKGIDEKKRYWNLCKLIADWAHQSLLNNPQALQYLLNRSINLENIKSFNLGYFPSGNQGFKSLMQTLSKESYLVQDLIDATIVAESKQGIYSPFEERILFPIADQQGRLCGFGGRIFKATDERAKYYNSKENEFFTKGSLLFGFNQARHTIQSLDQVFLVEGYMDCISMAQHGFTQTVATLGTACTLEHLKHLARFTNNLYILYDGDQAGQNAMLRLAELCWHVSIDLKVIIFNETDDPCSYLAQGKDLKPLIKNAVDIFDFFVNTSTHNFSHKNLNQKVQVARKIMGVIEKIDDHLKQDILLHTLAKACDISFESLTKELQRLPHHKGKNELEDPTVKVENHNWLDLKEIPELEKKIFSVIINNITLLKAEDEYYIFSCITTPLKELLKKLKVIQGEQVSYDFSYFFDTLSAQEQYVVSQILLEFHEYDGTKNYENLLAQFQKNHWKKFVKSVKNDIEEAQQQGKSHDVTNIIAQFQQLKQRLLAKGLI